MISYFGISLVVKTIQNTKDSDVQQLLSNVSMFGKFSILKDLVASRARMKTACEVCRRQQTWHSFGNFCKKNIAIWYTLLLKIAALSLTTNVLNYEISSVVFQIELCQRCKQLN